MKKENQSYDQMLIEGKITEAELLRLFVTNTYNPKLLEQASIENPFHSRAWELRIESLKLSNQEKIDLLEETKKQQSLNKRIQKLGKLQSSFQDQISSFNSELSFLGSLTDPIYQRDLKEIQNLQMKLKNQQLRYPNVLELDQKIVLFEDMLRTIHLLNQYVQKIQQQKKLQNLKKPKLVNPKYIMTPVSLSDRKERQASLLEGENLPISSKL